MALMHLAGGLQRAHGLRMLVLKQYQSKDFTPYRVCEMIATAKDSYFYKQCVRWQSELPIWVHADSHDVFRACAALAAQVIESGYDEKSMMWWWVKDSWREPADHLLALLPPAATSMYNEAIAGGTEPAEMNAIMRVLMLMDFGRMLTDHARTHPGDFDPFTWVFFELMLGKAWMTKYVQIMQTAKQNMQAAEKEQKDEGKDTGTDAASTAAAKE